MAGKGRPPKPELPWYADVAKLMVRDKVNFTCACQAMGIKVDRGVANLENTKAFQRVLWQESGEFFGAIGGNPNLTKDVVLGYLAESIKYLFEKGEYDKVSTASQTLAKIAGWLKEEPGQTVFATLTQEQLDEVRKRIEKKALNVPRQPTGPN